MQRGFFYAFILDECSPEFVAEGLNSEGGGDFRKGISMVGELRFNLNLALLFCLDHFGQIFTRQPPVGDHR